MKTEIEAKLDMLATKLMEAKEIAEELLKVAPPEAKEALEEMLGQLEARCPPGQREMTGMVSDRRAAASSGAMCAVYESFKVSPVWPAEEK